MSQFDDDGEAFAIVNWVEAVEKARKAWNEARRSFGYKEYFKASHTWSRFWKRIRGKKVMTYEEWCAIVDKVVDLGK